jgi:prophage regulatory protein
MGLAIGVAHAGPKPSSPQTFKVRLAMSDLSPREKRAQAAIELTAPESQILRLREVVAITTFSRSSVYRLLRDGRFPRPIKLGVHARGWRRSDIENYLATRESAAFGEEDQQCANP